MKYCCVVLVVLLCLYTARSVYALDTITVVDNGGGVAQVGMYGSMVLNSSGFAVFSYYDSTNHDLKLAVCNDLTCTAPVIRILDSVGDVGQYPSVVVNSSGFPIIAYEDSTNNDLKLAVCSDATCTASTQVVVDNAAFVSGDTSIVLSSSGLPIISYGGSRLAYCNNPLCTAPTFVNVGIGGGDSSMALNSSGFPVISMEATGQDLVVAVCNDAACTAPTVTTLDTAGDVGGMNRVTLNSSGFPVISYYDATNQDLKLAVCTSAACTASTIHTVDSAGAVGITSSILLRPGNLPLITYFDQTNFDLKMAVCANPTCTTATMTAVGTTQAGVFTNVRLGSTGFPIIGYVNFLGVDLRLAVCDDLFCINVPVYSSVPVPGSTLALTGSTGSTQNTTIAVSNIGDAGTLLDVTQVSVSAGYAITGLPITGLAQGAAAVNIGIACVVPQPAGTLVVQTNEPGSPQYTYHLTCTTPVVIPPVIPPVTVATGGSSASTSVNNSSNLAPDIDVFDPALSKLGLLLPGQVGVTDEKLEWQVTVTNNGRASGTKVVITDTLRSELRIDRVDAPGGSVVITGQTVSVTYATLAPGQRMRFSIFTTVLQGIEVSNVACLRADNLSGERCTPPAFVQRITRLPGTGEIPLWTGWLHLVMGLAGLMLAGLFLRRSLTRSASRIPYVRVIKWAE